MQISSCLIPVIDIETRGRKGCRHGLQLLLLYLRVASEVLAFTARRCITCHNRALVPLVRLAIRAFVCAVDYTTHYKAEAEKDENEAKETCEEHCHAANIDVGRLITRMFGIKYFGLMVRGVIQPSSLVCMFGLQKLFEVWIVHVNQRTSLELRQVVRAPKRKYSDWNGDVSKNSDIS
jgi:hypothetical protein